jgi:hypothetical protein
MLTRDLQGETVWRDSDAVLASAADAAPLRRRRERNVKTGACPDPPRWAIV